MNLNENLKLVIDFDDTNERIHLRSQIKEILDETKPVEDCRTEGIIYKDKGFNILIEFLERVRIRL